MSFHTRNFLGLADFESQIIERIRVLKNVEFEK
jgi:hypothetical protein